MADDPTQQPAAAPTPTAPSAPATPPATPAATSVNQQFSPAAISAREAAQDKVEASHEEQRSAEEMRNMSRLQAAENAPLPQQQHIEMPALPKKSPVDPKEFEQFATGLMAIAMLSIARGNQDRWINTLNTLNGSMKGYIDGNQAQAKQEFENYDRQFKSAMAQQQQADKEYQSILSQRDKSINQISREMSIAAAKWGHVQMQDAAQRRSIDNQWRTAEQMQNANARLQEQHDALATRVQMHNDTMAVMFAMHGLEMKDGHVVKKPEAGGEGNSAELENMVALARAGQPRNQITGGYGKDATALWRKVESQAIDQIMKENPGMSRQDAAGAFAMEQINLKGRGGSIAQLQKMQGATVQAVSQLDFNIKKTQEALKNIPSSDLSPVTNAIARGEEKWSGDPRYANLFYYMSATAMESARILQGGQASVAQLHEGARAEAKEWADINMTPKVFNEGVAPAMLAEGQKRVQTYQDAIEFQQRGGKPPATAGETAPLPGQGAAPGAVKPPLPPRTNAKGWTLHQDKQGNMAYVSPDGKQYEEVK